jgi:hypothetical protein
MAAKNIKENTGAWVIHHGKKLVLDLNGAAEYPAIDQAAKAATLLAKLGETDEATVPKAAVKAIATASGLNPHYELDGLLGVLQSKRLVDVSGNEITVLGVTTRGALGHAADLFEEASPSKYERAAIHLGDTVSIEPLRRKEVAEEVGDKHKLASSEVAEFLNRAEQIGFVDSEGEGDDRLLFNGNLFKRDSVQKTARVLSSLNSAEEAKVQTVRELLENKGCVLFDEVEKILGVQLFEKMRAAGLYDINIVGNEMGDHAYVTSPAAFHKFVNPMVDDCFDMAKALVSALTYGITARSSSRGRITLPTVLIGRLINGHEVGPATAIGMDYRVLEVNRVVALRPDARFGDRFYMRLLKREVGELALQVLTTGDASAESLTVLPGAPMSSYTGPEDARVAVRKKQTPMSRRRTQDVLDAVRGGGGFK